MNSIALAQGAASSATSPPVGSGSVYIDVNNHLKTLSNSAATWCPYLHAGITADTTGGAGIDGFVLGFPIEVGSLAVVGTQIYLNGSGTYTSQTATTPTFTVRAGTLAGPSDASICGFSLGTTPNSGTAIAFSFRILVTIRSVGVGSGTTTGSIMVINSGTTGISSTVTQVVTATGSSLTLTTPTSIDMTMSTGSGLNSCTFKTCDISLLSP